MNLKEKLQKEKYREIWSEYCGFLDLDLEHYMQIQRRLMEEQIQLWSNSPLGQSILKGKHPKTIEEFRKAVPLTTYDDYADILLQKRADMLPGNPIIWIQTTWEGGKHPIKLAPYTRGMLDTYRTNVCACLILSSSTEKGEVTVKNTDKILYALAPLPFATGLFPLALNEEVDIRFLPDVEKAQDMTFSERNKLGFKLALEQDVEYFFVLGSVAYAVSQSFSGSSSGGSITDNRYYKDDLEKMWGVRPMELFAGTEPSIIGTETWTRNGMYFFPDTCFYEFIRERDMEIMLDDPGYQPQTCLMDEVEEGENYEIVLTVLKGGAFARYRVGDMYRCVGLTSREDDTRIPRFEYIDRVPDIIDIAGFTRISETGINNVIQLSGLSVRNWVAMKELTEQSRPFLHIYVEMERETLEHSAVSTDILKELMTTYFKYIDQDYRDLKKILGMDPLCVTILRCGTFQAFEKKNNRKIRHMRPALTDLRELLQLQKCD